MAGLGEVVGVVGGLVGIAAGALSIFEWIKVRRKIAMLTDASAAAEILPAWYTSRMMSDHWCFGLLTESGRTIVIKRITALSDDGKWMDVELATPEELESLTGKVPDMVGAIAADRANASVQIANIVAARELWTS